MRWTEEQYNSYLEAKNAANQDRAAVPAHHLEQATGDEPMAEEEIQRLGTPCRIHVHSKRKKLCDSDGISAKAVLDGIVRAGLLPDDSPEYVEEVSYSQEKVGKKQNEETEVIISW